jgi:dephospho-CoA kinase
MAKQSDKFIIGLTGNIASGKSVVRKMLEHLGAYGIDADALGHRAIAKNAPAYQPVVDTFGKWILKEDGQIDRDKLGKLVFADQDALSHLEEIVHPLVGKAVNHLVKKCPQQVVVVEAIKLLESSLREVCDSIWVVEASDKIRKTRLVERRGMDEEDARIRMESQPPQEEKIVAADVVIENDGSFEQTWLRVKEGWKELFPEDDDLEPVKVVEQEEVSSEEIVVFRARPQQAEEIASFITRVSGGQHKLMKSDVMEAFGEKAFLLLMEGEKLIGLVGWQIENLVTRIDEIYLDNESSPASTIPFLLKDVESASRELQAEASLVFVKPDFAKQVEVWSGMGYEVRTPDSLGVNAWKEAANESKVGDSIMLFKQLRVDRILRPM